MYINFDRFERQTSIPERLKNSLESAGKSWTTWAIIGLCLLGLSQAGQAEKCYNLSMSAWDNAGESEAWTRTGMCLVEATVKGGVTGAKLTGQGLEFIFNGGAEQKTDFVNSEQKSNELPQTGEFKIPVKQGVIINTYRPLSKGQNFHWGVDVAPTKDMFGKTNVYSMQMGVVTDMNDKQGRLTGCDNPAMGNYGNYVIVTHQDGTYVIYGHFTKIFVKEGQGVNQETALGLMGSTGCSSIGEHVHVETHQKDGININPSTLISDLGKSYGSAVKR